MARRAPFPFLIAGAMAGLAAMAAGCATTHRFVVDPVVVAGLPIASATLTRERALLFDDAGGRLDPATGTVRGVGADGRPLAAPLAEVRHVTFRPGPGTARGPVTGDTEPLREGDAWRPDGRIQFVVKSSGEVLDLRLLPSRVDASARLVSYAPTPGVTASVPFADVAYVQIRDSHPGRTVLCAIGVAWLGLAIGIAISGGLSWSIGGA